MQALLDAFAAVEKQPWLHILGATGLGSLIWFCYRAVSGYWTLNLSVSLTLTRERISGQERDYILARTTLKKGNQGNLIILDTMIQAREVGTDGRNSTKVVPLAVDPPSGAGGAGSNGLNSPAAPPQIEGISRIPLQRGTRMDATRFPRTENLFLAPGDEMSFATLFDVPTGVPIAVDVAVLGERMLAGAPSGWLRAARRDAQWRSSSVALALRE